MLKPLLGLCDTRVEHWCVILCCILWVPDATVSWDLLSEDMLGGNACLFRDVAALDSDLALESGVVLGKLWRETMKGWFCSPMEMTLPGIKPNLSSRRCHEAPLHRS